MVPANPGGVLGCLVPRRTLPIRKLGLSRGSTGAEPR